MRNFEEATTWPREDMPAAEPRPSARRTDTPSPAYQAGAGADDILGGAYGPSWRESPEIMFALRAAPEGLVFDAINGACEKSLGVADTAVAGRAPTDVLPATVGGPFLVGCLQCAASAKTTRFTHAMALERRRRHWDTTLTPVCDESGVVFLILGRSREVAASSGPTPAHVRGAVGETGAVPRERGGEVAQLAATDTHVLSIDRDWRIRSVSPAATDWTRLEESDAVGQDIRVGVQFSGAMYGAIDAALTIGQPSQLVSRSLLRPGRWLDFQVEPTDAGAVISFRDVTSEAAGLKEHPSGGDTVEMALLDARGVILSVNAAWREAFGQLLQPDGRPFGVGAPYEEICRHIIPDLDADVLHAAMRQLLARDVHTLTHAHVVVAAAGPRWRQIRILPLKDDVAHFIAVHEDLTEVARTQAALRRTSEQLASAQHEERERIAIELHDSTGEQLAALGVGLARLRQLMGSSATAQGILDDMAASIGEAAKEIRVMSYLMKPPSLHRNGLEATARRHVKGFGIRTGLAAVFRSDGPLEHVSAVIQHAAFRVIQEALSNVHRHAHANGVEVELAVRGTQLTLRVADDGRGIAPLRQARLEGIPPGVGIPGMRSRVEHLGGWFDIATSRAGTVVTATIPLPNASRTSAALGR